MNSLIHIFTEIYEYIMGKRKWKLLSTSSNINTDMIEHTITKYVTQPTQHNGNVHHIHTRSQQDLPSTKITWPKQKCLQYIKEKQKQGFVIGANVITSYGNEGTISSIRDVPEEGLSFFGIQFPNIFTIYRPLMGDNRIYYNESELKLTNK